MFNLHHLPVGSFTQSHTNMSHAIICTVHHRQRVRNSKHTLCVCSLSKTFMLACMQAYMDIHYTHGQAHIHSYLHTGRISPISGEVRSLFASCEALLFKRARMWQLQRPRLVMDITGQVGSGWKSGSSVNVLGGEGPSTDSRVGESGGSLVFPGNGCMSCKLALGRPFSRPPSSFSRSVLAKGVRFLQAIDQAQLACKLRAVYRDCRYALQLLAYLAGSVGSPSLPILVCATTPAFSVLCLRRAARKAQDRWR